MIIDFLNTQIDKDKLASALEVLLAFKKCESMDEFVWISNIAWVKLEQLEEFLEFLVNNKPLNEDTIKYMMKTSTEETQ